MTPLTRLLAVVLLLLAAPAWAQTPPTGFATAVGNAWVQGSGVATAPAVFSTMSYNTPVGPNQEAFFPITTLPTVGGDICVNFRIEDGSNRYRICLTRVSGNNNDTVTLVRVATATGTTTLAGPVNLGVDVVVGDQLGVKVVSDAITGMFNSATWEEWREVITGTATSTPATSYIGVGAAAPVTITSFGGGGDAVGGDAEAPSTPGNCVVTTLSQTEQSAACDVSTDNVGVFSYSEKRCSGAACTPTTIIRDTSALTFIHDGLTANTLYRYSRRAWDGTNFSSESSISEATTFTDADTIAPAAPTLPRVSRTPGATASQNDAVINWTECTDTGGSGVNIVHIERGDAAGANFQEVITTGPTNTANDAEVNIPLTGGSSYRLRCEDLAGNVGSYSNNVLLPPVSGGRMR